MRAARTVFKNVGLQSAAFETDGACVAVVGDEGLDMPLRSPDGEALFGVQHVPWRVRDAQRETRAKLGQDGSPRRRCARSSRSSRRTGLMATTTTTTS